MDIIILPTPPPGTCQQPAYDGLPSGGEHYSQELSRAASAVGASGVVAG